MNTNNRSEIITSLVSFGHSSIKALEIAIDAERNDLYAIAWISTIKIDNYV